MAIRSTRRSEIVPSTASVHVSPAASTVLRIASPPPPRTRGDFDGDVADNPTSHLREDRQLGTLVSDNHPPRQLLWEVCHGDPFTTTVITEAIEVLAALAPSLRQAIETAVRKAVRDPRRHPVAHRPSRHGVGP
jgi:hypothetical protein